MSSGGLAQLARAPALHAGGRGFESHILHQIEIKLELRVRVFLLKIQRYML